MKDYNCRRILTQGLTLLKSQNAAYLCYFHPIRLKTGTNKQTPPLSCTGKIFTQACYPSALHGAYNDGRLKAAALAA